MPQNGEYWWDAPNWQGLIDKVMSLSDMEFCLKWHPMPRHVAQRLARRYLDIKDIYAR